MLFPIMTGNLSLGVVVDLARPQSGTWPLHGRKVQVLCITSVIRVVPTSGDVDQAVACIALLAAEQPGARVSPVVISPNSARFDALGASCRPYWIYETQVTRPR